MAAHTTRSAPTLAVWKFASCDGCQLSLLDCEDELPEVIKAYLAGRTPQILDRSVCY